MSSRSIVAFLVTSSIVFAACGGAESGAPPSNAPRSEAPEPASVEDAQQQIARARAEIGPPGAGAPADSARKSEPSSTTPPPAPPPPPPVVTRPDSKAVQEEAPSRNIDSCQSPCRAIASMRRAVTALCRMTGTDDARCTDAKKTLAESETKLVPCGC
jgi:outer membrane biosynthesis protein TonB